MNLEGLYDADQALTMLYAGEGQWLDGPKLAGWIRQHFPGDLSHQLGGGLRRVQLWERGTPAELDTADKILTRLGGHIHMLPPDFWISPPKRKPRRKPGATPQEVAA